MLVVLRCQKKLVLLTYVDIETRIFLTLDNFILQPTSQSADFYLRRGVFSTKINDLPLYVGIVIARTCQQKRFNLHSSPY